MRPGHKSVAVTAGANVRTSVDRTAAEFAATAGYGGRAYATRDDFLRVLATPWIAEFHEALGELLEPTRSVLSTGSGECEHEIPFVLAGYRIVASDIAPQAFRR